MVLDQILQIRITEDERKALDVIAEREERSLSYVIRQAIREHIDRNMEAKPRHGAQADRIREFCKKKYIDPARERGAKEVEVHVGTLARELGLQGSPAAVVGAIGADKFKAQIKYTKKITVGPTVGLNVIYRFLWSQ